MGSYIKPINLSFLNLSGGTVTGDTYFTQNLSATTFYGDGSHLSNIHDFFTTSGTYSDGVATFYRNDGIAYQVSGFTSTDTFVSGFSYSNNNITLSQTMGKSDLFISINLMTGLTINGILSSTTISSDFINSGSTNINEIFITPERSNSLYVFKSGDTITGNINVYSLSSVTNMSANTYYGDGSKLSNIYNYFTTGGTYNNGTATFYRNDGNSYNISGFTDTDTYVTGFTYNNNNIILNQNQGKSPLSVVINSMTGLTVSGYLYSSLFSANSLSALTINSGSTNISNIFSTPGQSDLKYVFKSGDTMSGSLLINSTLTVTGQTNLNNVNGINYSATQITLGVRVMNENNIILSGDVINGGSW